jgi:hypothetical protein
MSKKAKHDVGIKEINQQNLWELGIKEVSGHNVETAGRDEVNKMLAEGWILLHIYTLKYREDDIWRERPMVILGKK